MNSAKNLYNPKFSHIYVEKRVRDDALTKKILERFPASQIIETDHYKDVFNRKHQDALMQHAGQALILAEQEGSMLYPGAPVCQDFGNDHFYYTSNVMNCIYDCEYCYLKGMYPSGNMVIFVNIEDTFKEVQKELARNEMYLCVSYDTDLMAIEDITGFVSKWCDFAAVNPGLTIEIRTKSPRTDIYDRIEPCKRVIFAYTISPDQVADKYEHGTGNMRSRIEAAETAIGKGFSVRLCFDPMIICPDWKKEYTGMLGCVKEKIDPDRLVDVSVGSFRISAEYMKQMRKTCPMSAVVQFPYVNVGGVYQYPDRIRNEMEDFLIAGLEGYMPKERIFRWEI